jgi:hypothetical protein
MNTPLTEAEFGEQVLDIERSALRLELQRTYVEPIEVDTVARFYAGHPQDPTELPFMRNWYDRVRRAIRAGKQVARVRVQEDPPTAYQQWERFIGPWGAAAGEDIRYLTRAQAHKIGLLPAAGNTDWWLLDRRRIILMGFDDVGRRIRTELTDDPATVEQACAWWDLAVRHGVLDNPRDAVTA